MDLSDAVADAYFAGLRRLSEAVAPPVSRQGDRGVELLLSGVPLSRLNGVFHRRRETDPGEVDRFAATAARAAVPWTIQTRVEPSRATREIAAKWGRTEQERTPTMVCRPADLTSAGDEAAGLTVRVVGSAGHDDFLTAMAAGFEMPMEVTADIMPPQLLDLSGATAYVGYVAGRPVATAYGIRGGDLVGVMNVATEPAARRRGYGRALTERVVRDAFADGAVAAYLHASDEGLSLYRAMGFRTVETWTYFV
ncbi:GNAT family N-acetyltransferase [Actinoplanes sp. NPDC048796]|uniref:GNAT family N-acetyltransferase n=1 Tax=Actinoplanes sp. NPDC048796 TaxID=3155640 RepID=UPI0033FEC880